MTFSEWYEKSLTRTWVSLPWVKDDLQDAFRAGMKQGRDNERKRQNRKPAGIALNEQEKQA